MAHPTTRDLPTRRSRLFLDVVWEMRKRGFLEFARSAWERYGDVFAVQIAGRMLVFAVHPEHIRHVNITNRQNYDKLASYEVVRQYLLGDGVLASTGEQWRRQRRLLSPFFTPRAVEDYAGLMIEDGLKLHTRWDRLAEQGREVEISEEMMRVTASIILRAMFSMHSDEEVVHLKTAVETMIGWVAGAQGSPLRPPVWVPTTSNRAYQTARRQVHQYIDGLISRRRSMPVDQWPDDLLSKLLNARDEDSGEPMTDRLVRDEGITIFFAGHETTARTLTFAWYALAANPQVENKLHEELDRELGDGEVSLEALRRLPYTLRVVKETLRLFPAAPMYARDSVAEDELGGYRIPAGSTMMLVPYLTHRHPDFWPRPEEFNPDRWTAEAEKEMHPYSYHPFAAGQRICIGNSFSLLETHLLLAILARRYRPRLRSGHEPIWEMRGTLGSQNGMPMVIEPR